MSDFLKQYLYFWFGAASCRGSFDTDPGLIPVPCLVSSWVCMMWQLIFGWN